MKVSDLMENEFDNIPSENKTHIRSLRKKMNALQHQIDVASEFSLELRFGNHLEANPELRGKLTQKLQATTQRITDLGKLRDKIRAEIAKAALNMKTVIHDPEFALRHAKSVRKGEFPEGEDAIASDPKAAYEYATTIINKRFLKGEPAIVKVPALRNGYRQIFGTINYEYPPNEDK